MRERRAVACLRPCLPVGLAILLTCSTGVNGQTTAEAIASAQEPNRFKQLSLDELMDLEVSLVTRRPQRIAETPSAIQVITGEEIRRSGAMTLPEALRLAPNLHVARLNAHDWAISARGFNGAPLANNSLADKLLVMIDGRSVYSPLFGGVFWDVQNVLLEDVDRIEVVSGPGGTLWGANAVNGVINVVTRSAKETQGLYLTAAAGTLWKDFGAMRYGGRINDQLHYRIYAQGFQHNGLDLPDGSEANDQWSMHQTGFRLDYEPSGDDRFILQGDIYSGRENDPVETEVDGGNVLGRWTHVFSSKSEFSLQFYFDAALRNLPLADFADAMRIYDIDFQHRFPIGDHHSILWGLGYRLIHDRADNSAALLFDPARTTLDLFSGFIQDEIALVPDRLTLTIGSKFEHNDYSGFEIQPSARIAWTINDRNTAWGAISRAVRSPARFDTEASSQFLAASHGSFDSEKVTAYELGYRVRPLDMLSLSIAGFYNRYDDLRSINDNPSAPPLFIFANDQEAETWGVELAAELQMSEWWRIRGGYTYLDKNIRATSPAVVDGSDTFEGNDPYNQFMFQSIMDLPHDLELDVIGRYVGSLPEPEVPGYCSLDVRLAWQRDNWELAVVGQDLLDTRHAEFGSRQVPRSVYGQFTVRW